MLRPKMMVPSCVAGQVHFCVPRVAAYPDVEAVASAIFKRLSFEGRQVVREEWLLPQQRQQSFRDRMVAWRLPTMSLR